MEHDTLPDIDREAAQNCAAPLVLRWLVPAGALIQHPIIDGMSIGRDETCRPQLSGNRISRFHATVVKRDGQLWLRDGGSTNGTWVNGKRITETELRAGTLLRLGDWLARVEPAQAEPSLRQIVGELYGGSALVRLLSPVQRVSQTDLPVILSGETGTGKELVARAVHQWSGRAGRFVAVNCSAIPDKLAESELFGYRQGAFSGAVKSRAGWLRAAHQGTLFLDEVQELSLPVQAKLLRALQERAVVPLGESLAQAVDFRVVVGAQGNLAQAVSQGAFRHDLFTRLCGLDVVLPPLRERVEDITALFETFLKKHASHALSFDARFAEGLCLYDWPGNVRELDNLAQRCAAEYGSVTLTRSHLPDVMKPERTKPTENEASTAERREREYTELQAELSQNGGNISAACSKIGISRQHAYRVMKWAKTELEDQLSKRLDDACPQQA